jgi:pimeloyl-ACP methyl ester carboxylesterase
VSGAPAALHVEIEGDGPAIVLGHGFGGSARNFRATARALRDRWRVVLFDARGHARSEAPRDPTAYAPEAFVADWGRVLDAAGVERAVVGGLSMGAATALAFALAHPERVRALVLAAYPGAGGIAPVAERFADAIERRGLDAAGAEFVWGRGSDLGEAGARLVRQGFLEHPPHGLAATLRGLLARQPSVAALAPALRGLDVPALVIVGARDGASLAASRALAAALPRARLVEVPDAGHVVNLEQPRAFNAALAEFLAGLPPLEGGRSS